MEEVALRTVEAVVQKMVAAGAEVRCQTPESASPVVVVRTLEVAAVVRAVTELQALEVAVVERS